MVFLKEYARAASGRRVILTIHQPSSFVWQLIDNVVLLSKGKVMYEGSRVSMEAFFASHGYPTPEGWNPADHYVTLVNDEFRNHAKSVDEWSKCYSEWQETHHLGGPSGGGGGSSGRGMERHKSRTASMKSVAGKDAVEAKRSTSFIHVVGELTYRYFLNLWFNPGILATRVAMYTMLGE
jgi:ABC-type multidrug transport system ATPase subunit